MPWDYYSNFRNKNVHIKDYHLFQITQCRRIEKQHVISSIPSILLLQGMLDKTKMVWNCAVKSIPVNVIQIDKNFVSY